MFCQVHRNALYPVQSMVVCFAKMRYLKPLVVWYNLLLIWSHSQRKKFNDENFAINDMLSLMIIILVASFKESHFKIITIVRIDEFYL